MILRLIKHRPLKMNPKLNTSLRSRGKWGDFVIALVPLSWCGNILTNSNFILRMIEWQNETSLFTVRVHGKQWYWVYKFDVKDAIDIVTAPKNIGRNRWVINTPNDLKICDTYLEVIQSRAHLFWLQEYWTEIFKKELSPHTAINVNPTVWTPNNKTSIVETKYTTVTQDLPFENVSIEENSTDKEDEQLISENDLSFIKFSEKLGENYFYPYTHINDFLKQAYFTTKITANSTIRKVIPTLHLHQTINFTNSKYLDFLEQIPMFFKMKQNEVAPSNSSALSLNLIWKDKLPFNFNIMPNNNHIVSPITENTILTNPKLKNVQSTNNFMFNAYPYKSFSENNQINTHYEYIDLENEWDIEHNIKKKNYNNPLRLLKTPQFINSPNTPEPESTTLFKFRFFDANDELEEKLYSNSNFLILKQKRYKKKQAILNSEKLIINQSTGSKEIDSKNFIKFYAKRSLYDNKIFINTYLQDGVDSYTFYKCVRNNRKRSEFLPVTLCRRLLRTKRTLVLPAHVNLTIVTNSYDIVHSWFLPGLGLKLDCVPGRSTHHSLYLDNIGFYYGQCAEICGRYHHHMPIRVCALPFEHFLVWWHIKGLPKLLKINKQKKVISTFLTRTYVW